MSLGGKLKKFFIDEEEPEEIKKDVIQVEITSSKKEQEEAVITDSPLLKKEEKTSPVFFSDDDFNDFVVKREKELVNKTKYKEQKEDKIFRPTPIISPVYGVLDKNYKKDDITSKVRDVKMKKDQTDAIDLIRKKAFGTIVDDLESELEITSDEDSLFYDEKKLDDNKDFFDELEDKTEEVEETNLIEEEINNEDLLEDEIKSATDEEQPDDNDLFDLIDSLYNKGDEDR